MLLGIGLVILLATIYLLIKQKESRLILLCSGFLMSIIAGEPMAALKGFSHAVAQSTLFEAIISVMGFAAVLKLTECDKHLIYLLAKWLKKSGPFLIPGAVLTTFFVNTSIASAAGCAAAVGAILIPLLMAAGIHPAMAATAVLAGTYGTNFNPGYHQTMVVADVAKTTGVAVAANHFWPLLIAGVVGAITLFFVAMIRKETRGFESPLGGGQDDIHAFKVNYLKAFIPVLPLVILILGAKGYVPVFKNLGISHAMLAGIFAAFAVSWMNPAKLSKEFWHAAGDAFGHVCGIIICALVFVEGLKAIGVIKSLMDAMVSYPAIAKVSAAFGPFLLGVVSGSGDAASIAFNKAVTVHAAQFGLNPMDMGSVAAISAAIGRSTSPIAGAAIICASIAGVNPMELAKRNAVGMVLAVLTLMFIMLY
jgi:DcuC family C4-dicarboxylate transporter